MSAFTPPPTQIDPVEVMETPGSDRKRTRFNPQWLKWFVDLAARVPTIGSTYFNAIQLNTTYAPLNLPGPGSLYWDSVTGTLNIMMQDTGGLVQHAGLQQFIKATNVSGVTIAAGTMVRFSGAGGTSDIIQILPMLADNSVVGYMSVGVTAEQIVNNGTGFVCTFGVVQTNTSGFAAGDVLYASATVAGGLTKIPPTPPNLMIPVAVVLTVANPGDILVRPVLGQRLLYATFLDTTTQSLTAINTATAITLNTVQISAGITRGTPTSRVVVPQAGLYNFEFSLQVVSNSASTKNIYIWARVTGTDVANSASRITISGASTYLVPSWNFMLSLSANDYFELMWAADDTGVQITSPAATAFSPAIPGVILTANQVNQ